MDGLFIYIIDRDQNISNDEHDENFKPRKRLRKEHTRKSFMTHEKVQRGQEHYSRSGRLIDKKKFHPQPICSCRMRCHNKIDVERQHVIFQNFYDFPDWTRKTLYLRSSVEKNAVARKISTLNPIHQQKDRNHTYRYFLNDDTGYKQEVCNNFFYKCHQINSQRIYRALGTMQSNPTARERRGKQTSKNKTNEREIQFVKEFIAKFPKYKSHYGRKDSDRDYLAPHLNISKMY